MTGAAPFHRFDPLFAKVPERGITVSPDDDGFHARISLDPPIRYPRVALRVAVWVAVAGGTAWFAGDSFGLRRLLFGSILIFGLLFSGFQAGRAFVPAEVGVARGMLYFDGERLPRAMVAGLELREHVLVLRRSDGAEVGEIVGVAEASGRWLVDAVAFWLSEAG